MTKKPCCPISVPPGPPKDLHHTDVDKTEVWLVWNWPDRNGGSEITGFFVEYQEEGEKEWDEWKTVSIPETHVTGLEEGKTYRFRVKAENAIGLSRPDTTVPILCQEKLGESRHISLTAMVLYLQLRRWTHRNSVDGLNMQLMCPQQIVQCSLPHQLCLYFHSASCSGGGCQAY